MGLEKKVETLQNNQEIDRANISLLREQMGDIPKKLKDYELNLRDLIKESEIKMELDTSSLCAIAASLGKRENEVIISIEGLSKGTRQNLRKKSLKDVATSAANSIQDTAEIGNEVVMKIKEMQ